MGVPVGSASDFFSSNVDFVSNAETASEGQSIILDFAQATTGGYSLSTTSATVDPNFLIAVESTCSAYVESTSVRLSSPIDSAMCAPFTLALRPFAQH